MPISNHLHELHIHHQVHLSEPLYDVLLELAQDQGRVGAHARADDVGVDILDANVAERRTREDTIHLIMIDDFLKRARASLGSANGVGALELNHLLLSEDACRRAGGVHAESEFPQRVERGDHLQIRVMVTIVRDSGKPVEAREVHPGDEVVKLWKSN